MKLSTRLRYGCRAMVCLAASQEDGGPVALEALARHEQIPERYLAKIIQDLRRSGLIRSVRGAHGGYMLSRPATEITLLDVWQALEGHFCPVGCLDNPSECRMVKDCVTRDVWGKAREAIQDVLRDASLDKLARQHGDR